MLAVTMSSGDSNLRVFPEFLQTDLPPRILHFSSPAPRPVPGARVSVCIHIYMPRQQQAELFHRCLVHLDSQRQSRQDQHSYLKIHLLLDRSTSSYSPKTSTTVAYLQVTTHSWRRYQRDPRTSGPLDTRKLLQMSLLLPQELERMSTEAIFIQTSSHPCPRTSLNLAYCSDEPGGSKCPLVAICWP